MADEQNLPMPFPLYGLDVSVAYSKQPEQTTPEGNNVRGYEPETQRQRGGSRPGVSKFIPAAVGTGAIQALDTMTWTSTDALLDSLESLDGSGTTSGTADPSTGSRNPGRTVRTGGSGRQPNRNTGNQAGMRFIQKASATAALSADSLRSVAFSSDVGLSRLIVVIRDVNLLTSGTVSAVSDSQGNSYTNAVTVNSGANFWTIAYAITTLSGPCTVSFTPASDAGLTRSLMTVLEYSNPVTASTLDGTASAAPVDGNWTTGSLASASGTKELMLGVFFSGESSQPSIIPGTDQGPGQGNPFTLRSSLTLIDNLDYFSVFVLELIGTAANPSSTQAITGTGAPAAFGCRALGVSFKPR